MCIISTGSRENYINNGCSLGHSYKKKFFTTIKKIFSQVQKNVYFFSLQSMKMNTKNKI